MGGPFGRRGSHERGKQGSDEDIGSISAQGVRVFGHDLIIVEGDGQSQQLLERNNL